MPDPLKERGCYCQHAQSQRKSATQREPIGRYKLQAVSRLPERTPIKVSILISPQLQVDLNLYATLYREAYGQDEAVPDLIPPMLAAFLESDRAFT